MAFDYEAPQIAQQFPPKSPHSAGEVINAFGKATLDGSAAASHTVGLAILPKGCVPVDATAFASDLDTGSAMVFTVGVANASKDDLVSSTEMIASTSVGQAGGIARMNSANGLLNIKAKNVDRYIAAKIGTGASSAQAGSLGLNFSYRAAETNEWSASLT